MELIFIKASRIYAIVQFLLAKHFLSFLRNNIAFSASNTFSRAIGMAAATTQHLCLSVPSDFRGI